MVPAATSVLRLPEKDVPWLRPETATLVDETNCETTLGRNRNNFASIGASPVSGAPVGKNCEVHTADLADEGRKRLDVQARRYAPCRFEVECRLGARSIAQTVPLELERNCENQIRHEHGHLERAVLIHT